jgi:hypothetical protein
MSKKRISSLITKRQEDIKKIYKYVNSLDLKEPFFLLGSKHGTGLFLST